jgi:hypothetical protein
MKRLFNSGKAELNKTVVQIKHLQYTTSTHDSECVEVDDDRQKFVENLHIGYLWSKALMTGMLDQILQNCAVAGISTDGSAAYKTSTTTPRKRSMTKMNEDGIISIIETMNQLNEGAVHRDSLRKLERLQNQIQVEKEMIIDFEGQELDVMDRIESNENAIPPRTRFLGALELRLKGLQDKIATSKKRVSDLEMQIFDGKKEPKKNGDEAIELGGDVNLINNTKRQKSDCNGKEMAVALDLGSDNCSDDESRSSKNTSLSDSSSVVNEFLKSTTTDLLITSKTVVVSQSKKDENSTASSTHSNK